MIHETAIIDKDAQLGSNVSVGPYSCIESGVTIGDGCSIGPHVSILRYTTLGDDCEVHAGAVIGDTPQDTGFSECESFVTIGNSCRIREGVTIHRGTKKGTATVIGDGCFLMAFSHCAHNVILGNNVILANGVLLGGYVEVGDCVFLGGNMGVHQFVKIGRLVMGGGACGISKDVPPFCMLHPVSYNAVAGLNIVGLRRAGFSAEERKEIKLAFRLLYREGLNTSQAVTAIRNTFSRGPALEFCDFVERSERGICAAG